MIVNHSSPGAHASLLRTALPAKSMIATALALGVAVACASPGGDVERGTSAASSVPAPMQLQGSAYEAAMAVELPKVPPRELPGLHNVYALSDDIVSGSEPESDESFEVLARMGVRTILTVDGKVPDADAAAKHGMKYVHVPIQYSGISDDEKVRIAKTFRELEGPFYVHCFHGQHRGPAAAAIGRIVRDGVTRDVAIAEMRQWCGTAGSYEGLYRSIAIAPLPSADETRSYAFDFPAAQPLEGIGGAMVAVSRADDHLKFLSRREWQPDASHPDVDALNEATKLASVFERMAALDEVAAKPADFHGYLASSVKHSTELRDAIAEWRKSGGSSEHLTKKYQQLTKDCTACHKVYRN